MRSMRCVLGALLFAVAFAGPVDARAQAPVFDGQQAMRHLRRQVEFGPRIPGTAAHDECARWLVQYLRERADRVIPHSFVIADPYSDRRLQFTNVKASFAPDAAFRIAFAAHWDTRPFADRDTTAAGRAVFDGANDGASGVAVLLALADLLAASPPPIGVDLLLFDGEDYGHEGDIESYLIGSRHFARDFAADRPAALILLDMVGDRDLRIPMEAHGLRQAGALTRRVFAAAALLGLPAFDPVEGPAVIDDHIPFLQRGIPAIDLIDLDYPHWHTTRDTVDKCSADSLEQVGTLLSYLVHVEFAAGR